MARLLAKTGLVDVGAPVTSVSGSTGVVADSDIDHDSLANFVEDEHFTQANITALGTVTSGTLSTGAVIDDPTMTQGADATGDLYYRASDGKLTRLPTSTDGHVLTSAGAGIIPAWEAVAAPAAAMTLLDTAYNSDGDGSDYQTLEVTSFATASFKNIIVFFGAYGENGSSPYLHLGTASAYLADASIAWACVNTATHSTATSANDNGFHLLGGGGVNNDSVIGGMFHIVNAGNALQKFVTWQVFTNSGATLHSEGSGFTYAAQAAITRFKIIFLGTSTTVGDSYMYVYGLN